MVQTTHISGREIRNDLADPEQVGPRSCERVVSNEEEDFTVEMWNGVPLKIGDSGVVSIYHHEEFKASFDLTRMWGRDKWLHIVEEFDLELYRVNMRMSGDTYEAFVWVGDNVTIQTTYNPLTGERANFYSEKEEERYNPSDNLARCGYIHLIGEKSVVRRIYEFIMNNSQWKDAGFGDWIV